MDFPTTLQPADYATSGSPAASSRSRRAIDAGQRFLFGDDVFISYARGDAMNYSLGLANELTRRTISCFLDQWGTPPGDKLPDPLLRALRKSTMLVLVGTERAAASDAVRHEVKEFLSTGRAIIPISVDGALEQAAWFPLIRGLSLSREPQSALATGRPAEEVITRIVNARGFTSRNKRLRRVFWTTVAVTGVLALAGGAMVAYQMQQAVAASELARRARFSAQLEQDGGEASRLFESEQLGGLVLAMKAGRGLEALHGPDASFVNNLSEFQAISPFTSLINMSRARERNDLALFEDTYLRLRFSPNGKILAASSEKGSDQIGLFDVSSGQQLAMLSGKHNELMGMSFSPDGDVLAVGGLGAVSLYSTKDGKMLRALSRDEGFFYIRSFSPDGRFVAAAHEGRVRIWDTNTGGESPSLPGGGVISPDWKLLAGANGKGDIVLWDLATRTERARVKGHAKGGTDMVFSSDGSLLFTTGLDDKVIAWNVASASEVFTANAGSKGLVLSPDGRFLAQAGSSSDAARVWEIRNGSKVAEFPPPIGSVSFDASSSFLIAARGDGVIAGYRTTDWQQWFTVKGHDRYADVLFGPDGTYFASGGEDGRLKLWELAPHGPATLIRDAFTREVNDRTGALDSTGMVMSPNGGFVAAMFDTRVRLWDLPSGREALPIVASSDIRQVDASADGRTLVTVDEKAVTLWDVETRKAIGSLPAPPIFTRFLVSANGRLQAIARGDGVVEVRQLPSGQELARWKAPGVEQLSMSPDGTRLMARYTYGFKVSLLELASGKETTFDQGRSLRDVVFSASGSALITIGDNGLSKIWDSRTGQRYTLGANDDGVSDATISPDERLLAFSDGSRNIELWDFTRNQRITTIKLVDFPIYKMTFSPDSRVLAMQRNGGVQTKLWDVVAKREITTLRDTDHLDFSPNGQLLATRSYDGTQIGLWQVSTGREIGRLSGLPEIAGLRFAGDGKSLIAWTGKGTLGKGTLMVWPTQLGKWLEAGCAWLAPYLELHPTDNVANVLMPDGSTVAPVCVSRKKIPT